MTQQIRERVVMFPSLIWFSLLFSAAVARADPEKEGCIDVHVRAPELEIDESQEMLLVRGTVEDGKAPEGSTATFGGSKELLLGKRKLLSRRTKVLYVAANAVMFNRELVPMDHVAITLTYRDQLYAFTGSMAQLGVGFTFHHANFGLVFTVQPCKPPKE